MLNLKKLLTQIINKLNTLTNKLNTLTTLETLSISRVISTTYMTDTPLNRLYSYKKNGVLHLNFNAEFTGAGYTGNGQIATINGWNAIGDAYASIPCQTDSSKVLIITVRYNGKIEVYSTKPVSSWYRTNICIPCRS